MRSNGCARASGSDLTTSGDNTQCDSDAAPVHHLIERQALLRPDATALILDDQRVRLRRLNVRANRLAHSLVTLGVQPETRVGIAVERSVEMVVGLLAILKAGGAYVPLDPCYPEQRLAYMVEDSGIELLLTQQHLAGNRTKVVGLSVIELDRLDVTHHASTNPDVTLHGDHLAYAIYTSGSTGRPKGVAVSHGPLCDAILPGTWGTLWHDDRGSYCCNLLRSASMQLASSGYCHS